MSFIVTDLFDNTAANSNITDDILKRLASLESYVDSNWTQYTIPIRASTTNPTKGNTLLVDAAFYRQTSLYELEVIYQFRQTVAGGAGSGTYLFDLPSGYTLDTSVFSTANVAVPIGPARYYYGTTPAIAQAVINLQTDTSAILIYNPTNGAFISSGTAGLNNATLNYAFSARVPIK